LVVNVPVTSAATAVALATRPISETTTSSAASLWSELSDEKSDLA
jgi:hypothetical protein